MTRLILASQSPRRKQLLIEAGFAFEVMAPDDAIEASISRELKARELVIQSSLAKAQHIAGQVDHGIVIAADTVAECYGEILGKPADRQDARRMLELMSGRRHSVLTGVTIWIRPSNRHATHVEETSLMMKPWEDHQLDKYLDTDGWIGKAGAFGYQDGLDWVIVESGLESNVVGLPVERLNDWISELVD